MAEQELGGIPLDFKIAVEDIPSDISKMHANYSHVHTHNFNLYMYTCVLPLVLNSCQKFLHSKTTCTATCPNVHMIAHTLSTLHFTCCHLY